MLFYDLDHTPIRKSSVKDVDYTVVSFINTVWDSSLLDSPDIWEKIESLCTFEYLHISEEDYYSSLLNKLFLNYLKDLRGCVFYKCLFDSKDSKAFKTLNENNVVILPFFLNEKYSYENVTTFYDNFQSASYTNLRLYDTRNNLSLIIDQESKLHFFESKFNFLSILNRNHINFETKPSQEKFDGCKFTACNFSRFTNATSHFENSIFDRCAFSLDTFNTPKIVEIFLSKGRNFKPFVYERVKEFAKELKIENCVFQDIVIRKDSDKYKTSNPDWSEQVKTIFLFNDEIDLSTCKFDLKFPSPEKANLTGKDYNSSRLWKNINDETFTSMSDFVEKTHGWIWSMLSEKHFEECSLNNGIALEVSRMILKDCSFENCIVSFTTLPTCENVVFKDCTFEHPKEFKKVVHFNTIQPSRSEEEPLIFESCTFKNAISFTKTDPTVQKLTINDCTFEDFCVVSEFIEFYESGKGWQGVLFSTVLNRCHFEKGFDLSVLNSAKSSPFFWNGKTGGNASWDIDKYRVLKNCTFGKDLIVKFGNETLEGEEAIKFIEDCFVIQD
jgi:uncharacterized protein YjbI with pentapeptide repeats